MAMGRPKSALVLDSELREQLESLAHLCWLSLKWRSDVSR
jgi:hypothetical protein